MKNNHNKLLSHHAYVLIGSDSIRLELISILTDNFSIKVQGNPDFIDKKYETFTIGDAREIKSQHSMKPMSDSGKKISILTMNGITVEAQNALLKLLEEPNNDSHFFFIIPSAHLLLQTIKSRVLITDLDTVSGNESSVKKIEQKNSNNEDAEKFVIMPASKRLDFLKKLVDDIKSEKKTKQDAIDFLDSVQSSIYSEKGVAGSLKSLEAIELARKYIHDRAPSVKMLLEYVALNI